MNETNQKPPAYELPALEVTLIDGKNLPYFSTFIPSEYHSGVEDASLCAIGAISQGTACAALVAELNEACVQLLSVFVAPMYRRQYIASTLVGELLDFITENGELAIQSLAADYSDDGGGVKEFLDSLGFWQEKQAEQTLSLPVSSLPGCEFMQRTPSPGVAVSPLESLSAFHLREIRLAMESCAADYFGKALGPDTVLTELSFAAFRDRRPVGCVCLSEGAREGELVMTVFFSIEKAPPVPMTLLRAAAEAVMKHRPAADSIKIPILTESAGKLLRALTHGAAGVCETRYSAVLEI
jgi:N-acetylglutamate synthase-like GNAT family acetyltransferase